MKTFSPFNQSKRFAAKFNDAVVSLISALANRRSPAAIARLVIPVLIDAVNRHTGRFFAHILKEIGKTFQPSRTYGNAAFAIVLVVAVFGIGASGNHPAPAMVRSADAFGGVTVLSASLDRGLVFQASARSAMTVSQCGTKDLGFVPANATANPTGLAIRGVFSASNHAETVEGLAD